MTYDEKVAELMADPFFRLEQSIEQCTELAESILAALERAGID